MEHKLEWRDEEEGNIFFSEQGVPFLTVQFFITGEVEAEFRIQDIVFPEKNTESAEMREKVILKMNECISQTFLLVWNEGLEETVLVEKSESELAEILDSTDVVSLAYSEYMMKKRYEAENSTTCGQYRLKLTKTEEGYSCENTEKTFFCRLLSYQTEHPEEKSFYLYEVEVDKKKRNKGVATRCLTELFRQLAADVPVTIYLQVGSYNEPAVHLYKKLGFQVSEELRYYAAKE